MRIRPCVLLVPLLAAMYPAAQALAMQTARDTRPTRDIKVIFYKDAGR